MEAIQIVGIKNILQYINRMYLVYFPLMTIMKSSNTWIFVVAGCMISKLTMQPPEHGSFN